MSGMALSMVVETCGVLAHTLVALEIKRGMGSSQGQNTNKGLSPITCFFLLDTTSQQFQNFLKLHQQLRAGVDTHRTGEDGADQKHNTR